MVNIDTVYQKVLAIANKEQRGYITPQEFNLFANQAQMDIFEQYFYDLDNNKGNLVEEKLYPFKETQETPNGTDLNGISDFYRMGNVFKLQSDFNNSAENPFNRSVEVEEINQNDLIQSQNSPLTRATHSRPIYTIQNNTMYFYPASTDGTGNYRIYYIRKPQRVNWTYVVVSNKALYNPSAADHRSFELHESEEVELVLKISKMAGINLRDFNLAQAAGQEEINKLQQEN